MTDFIWVFFFHVVAPEETECVNIFFPCEYQSEQRNLRHTLLSSVNQAKHVFSASNFFLVLIRHTTFVQTSFKNINKLEPLRLTWQKTHYQMSWRRTNIFLEKDLQMRCHYKIEKKKVSHHTKKIWKHLKSFGINPFSEKDNSFFKSIFCFIFCYFTHGAKRERKVQLKSNNRA